MSLKSCPECGGKVSSKATTCPHCGMRLSPTGLDTSFSGNARSCVGCVVLVVILIIVLMVAGASAV